MVCYISFILYFSYIYVVDSNVIFFKSIVVFDNKYFIKYEKMYWVLKKILLRKKNNGL